ncbi:MAG: cytochrome d ubiquinol oxidase subunit II [bacterium]
MIDLNTTWFILVGVLITGYAILDGFDLGVGVLHLFADNEQQRRVNMNAIGPVWDGNEVWLLTAAGALFAAFPPVYATIFSGFYLAMMLILAALIFRAVSLEFRSKVDLSIWRRFWDWSFGLGSLLPALLFGVAVGNLLRGVPIDVNGAWAGSFPGLLNPYALLVGVLSLVMLVMHGAVYMTTRTEGDLCRRMSQWALRGWVGFVIVYLLVTLYSFFEAGYLFEGLLANPLFWLFLVMLLAAISYLPIALRAARYGRAFFSSAVMIVSVIALAAVSMYPRLAPSSIDLAYSLTAYNASSTPRTLTVMLIIAAIGMPIVIGYTVYMYRVFKGKVEVTSESY